MNLKKYFLTNDITIINITFFFVGFSLPFSLAFNSICLILFIAFSFFYFDKKNIKELINFKEIYFYFIIFYLIQILSYFYSANKNIALENLSRNVLFFILPITFLNIKHKLNNRSFKYLFTGLILSIILSILKVYSSLILTLPFFQIKDFLRERFVEKGIYNIHVPYFSMLILLVLIFTVKSNFLKNKKYNKIIKLILFFLLLISLFFLSGLMSFLILIFYIYSFFFKSKIKKTKKIAITFFFLLISISSLYLIKNLDKAEREKGAENLIFRIYSLANSKNNSTVRFQNWKSVVEVISENIFLGIGVDGGINKLLEHREPLNEPFVNKHNAHNVYLETLLRYGIIGFLPFSIILLLLIKKAFLTKNYFFIWFLIVFLISSLTESFLQRQIGIVTFCFFSLFFYTKNNLSLTS